MIGIACVSGRGSGTVCLVGRGVRVVGVSTPTAVGSLTAWGRVSWADPTLALANVVAAFVPMSIGAVLGDLPPEE